MSNATPPRRSVKLRGRAFKALVLMPDIPLPDWFSGLDASLKRSPSLFEGRPVILDASGLPDSDDALTAVLDGLAGRGIRLLGVEGAADGVALDLPRLVGGRPVTTIAIPAEPPEPPPSTSLTIEGSVRSGQSVVHPGGDVTVTGSVSSGAEILAGGSIHVYGALRGRAIAGAARNPRARIYCRKFEPELLGIDRLFRTAEDIGTHLRGRSVQIWLDGGAIRIASLG